MNNLFRGLLAGAGAAKFGGGCLGTILVFAIIWALLGTCDGGSHALLKKSERPPITVCMSNSGMGITGVATDVFMKNTSPSLSK